MNIFISHSSEDFAIAKNMCGLLEGNGHKCFLAPRDIRSGYEYAEEIMNGIESSELLILLLSERANSSPHVLREVERAVSKNKPIIVCKLEEVKLSRSMEYFLMSHQWVSAKNGETSEEILNCVAEFVSKGKEVRATKASQTAFTKNVNSKKSHKGIVILLILVVVAFVAGAIVLSGTEDDEDEKSENKSKNNSEEQQVLLDIEAGDTLVFGSYLEKPIEWRVLKVSEDGRSAVIVSKNILTMKAYDAAESGKYNYSGDISYWGVEIESEDAELLKLTRGNNDWEHSNIRIWLNSDREAVSYEDQAPTQMSMSEYKNGYDMEKGFLSYFTPKEREAILMTEVNTNGTITRDKVFLLSSRELAWFEEANVSMLTTPTEEALTQDDSDWFEVNVSAYGVEDYCWWLRDCAPDGLACQAYLVGSSYSGCEVYTENVGLEGYGIRPALTIDLTTESITIK